MEPFLVESVTLVHIRCEEGALEDEWVLEEPPEGAHACWELPGRVDRGSADADGAWPEAARLEGRQQVFEEKVLGSRVVECRGYPELVSSAEQRGDTGQEADDPLKRKQFELWRVWNKFDRKLIEIIEIQNLYYYFFLIYFCEDGFY